MSTAPRSPFNAWAVPRGVPDDTLGALAVVEDSGLRYPALDAAAVNVLARELRASRSDVVADHPSRVRAALLGRAGERFLDREDPLRRTADEFVSEGAGLTPEMARAVIEGMARDWTEQRLLALLAAELPDPEVLDGFVTMPHGTSVHAVPPALSLHVGAGTVPGVSANSLVRALLIGSAALVKPGRSDIALTVLFARALAEEAPALARMAAVVYWEGGSGPAESAALSEADLVVIYGGDATVRALRERLPASTPLVAYHHRASVAVIGREALSRSDVSDTAESAARAIAMFDQRGCVSPRAVLVEEGASATPRDFASALMVALAEVGRALPAAALSPAEGSAIHQLRGATELRAAAGEPVELFVGEDVGWTVVLEGEATLDLYCPHRVVCIHQIRDVRDVPAVLAPFASHLQTVGVAGLRGDRLTALADALGDVGVSRICGLGEVPFPPAWWHHDGQGPLRALLRWVDLDTGFPSR